MYYHLEENQQTIYQVLSQCKCILYVLPNSIPKMLRVSPVSPGSLLTSGLCQAF